MKFRLRLRRSIGDIIVVGRGVGLGVRCIHGVKVRLWVRVELGTDSIVLRIEGGVRVGIVVGLGPRLGVEAGVGRGAGRGVRFGHRLNVSFGGSK